MGQMLHSFLGKKYTSTSIKFNTETPDYEKFKTIEVNWGNFYAVYTEEIQYSCPPPMVKSVLITNFLNANLMPYLTMGISHTGIIHIMNKTPI